MIAAVLRGPRAVDLASVPSPTPGPADVVVRVTAAGLCGTDYRIWTGERPVRYPLVMGHEFVGTVAAVGPAVRNVSVGQAVAVEPNYSCGVCALCREGNRNLCLSRVAVGIDVDGGFAEEAVVPARCCWPAPPGLPTARLLLAEPLAVVVRAVGRAEPARGETAAVLGVGSLGLLAVQVLKARGCRVLAVARSTRRLDLARQLGAEAVALSGADDDTVAARAFSGREGVDLVVETAGTSLAVEQAVNLCRPGGRVVLTGLPHEATALNFFWVVRRELRIIGSMIYQDEFPEAMRLLATGAVQTERLLSQTFPLARLDEAFQAHRSPDSIKVAVVPEAVVPEPAR
jgi:2-desacetyl-2-hydroxyethyl bacteriochlorophyllide A dehydrogenase